MSILRRLGFSLVFALALAVPAAAQAAFPGQNGKIAYVSGGDIWTMNPDGTSQVNLTSSAVAESKPAWSPDGARIAFVRVKDTGPFPRDEVWVMDADGSGQSVVVAQPFLTCYDGGGCGLQTEVDDPSWSPDGSQITFIGQDDHCEAGGLFRVNPDGTGLVKVTYVCDYASSPSWSPDGSRIVFANNLLHSEGEITKVDPTGGSRVVINEGDNPNWSPNGLRIIVDGYVDEGAIYTFQPDGSDRVALPNEGHNPAWSPDGAKVVVDGVKVFNSDGTGEAFLSTGTEPDWQPILKGYARPKAATPFNVSLVPAYQACTSPNRAHAAPLSFGSCNPPAQTSAQATVGTPDANANPAKSVGALQLRAIGEVPINLGNGNQSDITIDFSLTDVRKQSNPADDYTAELRAQAALQITDRNNTPYPGGPGPGTVVPISFEFNVPCATTGDTTIGSTCALSTTANSLVPGQVLERQRAIWQLGAVEVHDGGTDGDADTPADNTLFAAQGIFVP